MPLTVNGVAQCCGCACGRCDHQGGGGYHTDACVERFLSEMQEDYSDASEREEESREVQNL